MKALRGFAREYRAYAERSAEILRQARLGNPQYHVAEGYTDEQHHETQSRIANVADTAEKAPRKKGRPPKYDDEHWRKVLHVYQQNLGGSSPAKAVAEHFGIKTKRASKWVAKATLREQARVRGRGTG